MEAERQEGSRGGSLVSHWAGLDGQLDNGKCSSLVLACALASSESWPLS